MFNLKLASIGIRKAAALKGIRSGKVTFLNHVTEEVYNDKPIAEIFNKNYPDGIVVTQFECNVALYIPWGEINVQIMR